MSKLLSVKLNNEKCYDIHIEKDYSGLLDSIKEIYNEDIKLCVVTDSNVEKLYLNEVLDVLKTGFTNVISCVMQAGEENKNQETVNMIYDTLLENKFNRHDCLIALGGGVVGDLCGYSAATYMRGIDFIQMPTTLLSVVDSSIGGKTGIDYKAYKNIIGAFKMPRLVYMNTSCLNTLDERQYASGMAEVLKMGLILDGKYYSWLINNFTEINDKDPNVISDMILRSIELKAMIVEKDPYEKGDRALLNLGHTIGHAIEKYMNFTFAHGECVALGTVAAAYISWKRDLIPMEDYYEIRDMFVPFNLPISIDDIDAKEILELTKSDKKAIANTVKFIVLKKVGKGIIVIDITDEEILMGIDEIKAKF